MGMPQSFTVNITKMFKRAQSFQCFGIYCWHAYSSNPKCLELHVSSDGSNFTLWGSFTAALKSGAQYFTIDPLGVRYHYLRVVLKGTYGANKTYLNQVFLLEENPDKKAESQGRSDANEVSKRSINQSTNQTLNQDTLDESRQDDQITEKAHSIYSTPSVTYSATKKIREQARKMLEDDDDDIDLETVGTDRATESKGEENFSPVVDQSAALKELQELRELKELKELRELRELRDLKELRELKDLSELRDFKKREETEESANDQPSQFYQQQHQRTPVRDDRRKSPSTKRSVKHGSDWTPISEIRSNAGWTEVLSPKSEKHREEVSEIQIRSKELDPIVANDPLRESSNDPFTYSKLKFKINEMEDQMNSLLLNAKDVEIESPQKREPVLMDKENLDPKPRRMTETSDWKKLPTNNTKLTEPSVDDWKKQPYPLTTSEKEVYRLKDEVKYWSSSCTQMQSTLEELTGCIKSLQTNLDTIKGQTMGSNQGTIQVRNMTTNPASFAGDGHTNTTYDPNISQDGTLNVTDGRSLERLVQEQISKQLKNHHQTRQSTIESSSFAKEEKTRNRGHHRRDSRPGSCSTEISDEDSGSEESFKTHKRMNRKKPSSEDDYYRLERVFSEVFERNITSWQDRFLQRVLEPAMKVNQGILREEIQKELDVSKQTLILQEKEFRNQIREEVERVEEHIVDRVMARISENQRTQKGYIEKQSEVQHFMEESVVEEEEDFQVTQGRSESEVSKGTLDESGYEQNIKAIAARLQAKLAEKANKLEQLKSENDSFVKKQKNLNESAKVSGSFSNIFNDNSFSPVAKY
eukprot:CAMPEP_0114983230 /NCGR_PEP_ID=MMETSP0216-20121206/6578_1 /TAXON_ID=223996 /ORGANISM="Protocruzia adherens, Strain Boccale" /LENGTH=811 /DNA_ID=CAMNT_0002345177 /DNA_START=147 /DNA_END=2582 /DNA_ORIENTATION=-